MWDKIVEGLTRLLFPNKLRIRQLELKLTKERTKKDSYYAQLRALKWAMRDSSDMKLRGCIRKVPHESREEAQCVAELNGSNTTPYKCQYCKQWHLTSKSKTK